MLRKWRFFVNGRLGGFGVNEKNKGMDCWK